MWGVSLPETWQTAPVSLRYTEQELKAKNGLWTKGQRGFWDSAAHWSKLGSINRIWLKLNGPGGEHKNKNNEENLANFWQQSGTVLGNMSDPFCNGIKESNWVKTERWTTASRPWHSAASSVTVTALVIFMHALKWVIVKGARGERFAL